jgi:hypothetical protein
MPIDPALTPDIPQDVARRALEKVAALEARVAALERGGTIPTGVGAPGAATGRNGSMYASTSNIFYVKIAGTWRAVTLA